MKDGLFERPSLNGLAHYIFFKILQVDIKNDQSRRLRHWKYKILKVGIKNTVSRH